MADPDLPSSIPMRPVQRGVELVGFDVDGPSVTTG